MKKSPTQQRSRQTVETLIEATARTIVERGWTNTTTNHIASRAGVGVGSLYQYFESREALLAALAEREIERLTTSLDAAAPALMGADPLTGVRTVLEIAFDHFEQDRALFTELANHWTATRSTAFVDAFEAYVLDSLRLFVTQRYADFEPIDLNTLAFILSNGTMFTISRFFSRNPRGVTKESLIEHITTLYALFFASKLRRT